MKHRLAGTAAGLLFILALAPAVAQAGPATVTVRVLGASHQLATTSVTTNATPITIDGHPCSGTSDGGALDQGVGRGNYAAHFSSSSYGDAFILDTVLGETYTWVSDPPPAFWSVMINGNSGNAFCSNELSPGDAVVFYAACNDFYSGPPATCYTAPVRLSGVPASIKPGQPFQVTVEEATIDQASNTTSYAPSAGATVTAGSATATTDAQGHATLTVSDRGPITVRATKGTRIDDSKATCATDGADGFCATTKAGAPAVTAPAPLAADHTPPGSSLTGLAEGRTYPKGKGPRELRGTVTDASGILMVKLRITRTKGGRCWYFSGSKLRFVGMRCGARHGSWFKIGSSPEWRYLLPERLPPGRYVVDVNAIDKHYNRESARRRGGNRVVFEVS
jgi:hypothetical protein